jgi:hypothetical protein
LGVDFMDEFRGEKKDSESDSWEEWLKMDIGDPMVVRDEEGNDSPFEEIDWDNAFSDGKDLGVLEGGAGPLMRRGKQILVRGQ